MFCIKNIALTTLRFGCAYAPILSSYAFLNYGFNDYIHALKTYNHHQDDTTQTIILHSNLKRQASFINKIILSSIAMHYTLTAANVTTYLYYSSTLVNALIDIGIKTHMPFIMPAFLTSIAVGATLSAATATHNYLCNSNFHLKASYYLGSRIGATTFAIATNSNPLLLLFLSTFSLFNDICQLTAFFLTQYNFTSMNNAAYEISWHLITPAACAISMSYSYAKTLATIITTIMEIHYELNK